MYHIISVISVLKHSYRQFSLQARLSSASAGSASPPSLHYWGKRGWSREKDEALTWNCVNDALRVANYLSSQGLEPDLLGNQIWLDSEYRKIALCYPLAQDATRELWGCFERENPQSSVFRVLDHFEKLAHSFRPTGRKRTLFDVFRDTFQQSKTCELHGLLCLFEYNVICTLEECD